LVYTYFGAKYNDIFILFFSCALLYRGFVLTLEAL